MPRGTVTPFPRKGSSFYWCRVPRAKGHGDSHQRSLGTTDLARAQVLCTWLVQLKTDHQAYLLDQLADGRATVSAAHDAFVTNQLSEFIDELRNPKVVATPVAEVDLQDHITGWQRHLEYLRKPAIKTRRKYLSQLRRLIPDGAKATAKSPATPPPPFPVSQFTETRIESWLKALRENDGITTTNRFRAAALSFGHYLKKEKVIAHNPVVDVPGARENPSRCRWLRMSQAKKVIVGMSGTAQAWHALAAATGMEGQAIRVFTPDDIRPIDRKHPDEREIQAHGEKFEHRDRIVVVYKRWRWAYDIFLAWLNATPHEGDDLIFADLGDKEMRRALDTACATANVTDYVPHDWRHTWAVTAIKDDVSLNSVAGQLGHVDPVMTLRTYGKFLSRASDFRGKGTRAI